MTFVLPIVLGHRGARAVQTENTIKAFCYCCQSGVRWVELDAMLSKDGTVMVFHDETLERMAGRKERTDELTAEQLSELPLKPQGRIPTLAEVLQTLNGFQACVNIEIKPSRFDLVRETARRIWQVVCETGFDDSDRLLFSSFAWDALEEVAVLAPHIRRGVLVGKESGDWRAAAKKVKAYSVNYDAKLLTPEIIAEIKKDGYRLMAYTVNDPDQAKRLYANGVDSFFCDDPVLMSKALA